MPVHVPRARESTALGAAMYAAVGRRPRRERRRAGRRHALRAHLRARSGGARDLRELFARWRAVYERTLEMVDDGVIRPLWRPAAHDGAELHAMGRRALEEIGAVMDRIPAPRRRAALQRDPRRGPHRVLRRRPRGADDQGALHAAHAPRPGCARRRRHDDASARARRPAARERGAGLVLDRRRARRAWPRRPAHARRCSPPSPRVACPRAPTWSCACRRRRWPTIRAAARACCRWAACTRRCSS